MFNLEPQLFQETEQRQETTVSNAQMILNMEEMIKTHIDALERAKTDKKKVKEALEDIYNNNPTYKEHKEKAKEASAILRATKAEIDKNPHVAELKSKMKDLGLEVKENQLSLFDYAAEYQRMAGVNEIQANDGEVFEIKTQAVLVKKSIMFK